MLELFISHEDVCITPASRPRVMKSGHTYIAKPYALFKKQMLEWIAKTGYEDCSLQEGVLHIKFDLEVIIPVTETWSKKRKQESYGAWCIGSNWGDIDNLYKAYSDSLIGMDVKVVWLNARKRYANLGELCGAKIKIERL